MKSVLSVGLLLVGVWGCGANEGSPSETDVQALDTSRAVDVTTSDTTAADSAEVDSNVSDSLMPDTPTADTQVSDIEPPDAEPPDAENPDAENPDAENPDADLGDSGGSDGVPPTCPGGAGCPCADDKACDGGLCLELADGAKCATPCTNTCAGDLTCATVSGGDYCVDAYARLCSPCSSNSDCLHSGLKDARCVVSKGEVARCGAACDSTSSCPTGYDCLSVTDVEGSMSKQCVPSGISGIAACTCTANAVNLATQATCTDAASGCLGVAACASVGKAPVCKTAAAAPESCDGVDNDCDGATDEQTCDDKNPCTQDSCDPAKGCASSPLSGTTCSDGDPCTTTDTCQAGVCTAGPSKSCDDQNPCTKDACDTKTGACDFSPVAEKAVSCDDGDACTDKDSCQAGTCIAGAAKACDDGNNCTDDSCDKAKGCLFEASAQACDDGNNCTTGDVCGGGVCTAGSAKDCDDKNPCTDDACDPKSGCTASNNAANCDDGDACTEKDACAAGACAGEKITCDDNNPCTADACDPNEGCTATSLKDGLSCGGLGGDAACASGTCVAAPKPPIDALLDYAFWYWPTNHRPTETWPKPQQEMHFLTGHYGAAFDSETAKLVRLGAVKGAGYATSRLSANSVVNGLPGAALTFEAGPTSGGVVATQLLGAESWNVDRLRMIDGGRVMNRLYVPTVKYAKNAALSGEVQVASMPRHMVWTHTVKGSHADAKTARVRLGGAAVTAFKTVKWLAPKRAVQLSDGEGNGWLFVVADDKQHTLSLASDGAVVAQRTVSTPPESGVKASLLLAPLKGLTAQELAMYVDPGQQAEVRYTLLNLAGKALTSPVVAPWDPELGAYRVTLEPLNSAGAPAWPDWDQNQYHNWYGRHRIEIKRSTDAPLSVPLALHGPHKVSFYITGGIPLWRDTEGNPLGLPLQISKNWHGQTWYHLYSQPTVSGNSALELTVASSRWGKNVYAASHAQLSLIGWGKAGGHWDETALGCFGESVTYDPDLALNRAMVDDVRPFLVQTAKKWNWTGNVGGADFLRYRTTKQSYWERRLSRVRSVYRAIGPNVTDVGYAGVSTEGSIQGDIRTQLVASDDLVRVYYHLNYTFLEDVDYSTLAFFQVAADNYADNGFTQYAYENSDGKIIDNKVNLSHKSTGYISDADRGLKLSKTAPWVLLYKSTKADGDLPELYANVGFMVRDYQLKVGDKTITDPHISITRTYNGGHSQMAFQVSPPHSEGATWCGTPCQGKQRFIPKGSTFKAVVEYVVLPADKSRYYGTSPHMVATEAADFTTYALIRRLAQDNALKVTATVGKILNVQPVEVEISQATVAADITVDGGVGYNPLTFRGLKRHDGWSLEQWVSGAWKKVDQAVHGGDYWQANHDAESNTWSLTFSVPNKGKQRYRLRWSKSP
jgi:hypothetical protein